MIAARRQQQSFADGLIHEAVGDLWGPWMRHADQALEDEALLLMIDEVSGSPGEVTEPAQPVDSSLPESALIR